MIATPPKLGAATTRRSRTQTLAADKTYDVTCMTNCGSFTIRLDQKQSPNAAASFVVARPARLLRQHDLPPDRPRLRDPGRRPDRHGRPAGPGTRRSTRRPRTRGLHPRRGRDGEDADRSRRARRGASSSSSPCANAGLPARLRDHRQGDEGPRRSSTAIGKLGDAKQQPTQIVEIEQRHRQGPLERWSRPSSSPPVPRPGSARPSSCCSSRTCSSGSMPHRSTRW